MKSLHHLLALALALASLQTFAQSGDEEAFGLGVPSKSSGKRVPGITLPGVPAPGGPEAEVAPAIPSRPVMLNRIVAVVNDDIIVQSELDVEITSIVNQLAQKETELPSPAVLEKQVLERLVVQQLQLQLAERSGVRIDDATLNNRMRELASENGVTLTEFRQVLERDGFDYGKFREEMRKQMMINKLRAQMVTNRISVSDQEIDNLLANLAASQESDVQYHLAHILIAVPEAASPEEIQAAQQRAEDLLVRLRGGADFTQAAISQSDGQSALDGGDIGWRSMGQMPTLFVEPLKNMETGDVSDLIRSPGGFHIIKLVEQRGGERYIIDQTRVRHILIKPDAIHSHEETRIRMEQIEIRLRGGEDFSSLARSNSQDTLSAAKGGDLGWVSPGDLVPEFEEVMNRMATGQVSRPFETQFGWHILQVTERREYDSTEEYKRTQARQLIRSRKRDEQLFLWLRRLRDEAYVEYRLDA